MKTLYFNSKKTRGEEMADRTLGQMPSEFIEMDGGDYRAYVTDLGPAIVEADKNIVAIAPGLIVDRLGNVYDFEAVVNLMDDEIREELHFEMAPCKEQEFFDAYCRKYEEKFKKLLKKLLR